MKSLLSVLFLLEQLLLALLFLVLLDLLLDVGSLLIKFHLGELLLVIVSIFVVSSVTTGDVGGTAISGGVVMSDA